MVEANAGCLVAMLSVFAVPFSTACVFFIVAGLSEACGQTAPSPDPYLGALFGVAMLEFIALGLVFLLAWRWFGWFTLGAFAVSVGGLMVIGWIGWEWQAAVPGDQRPAWMAFAIGGAGAACFGPAGALLASRTRAGEYREALGIVAAQTRMQQEGDGT